jgi:DNA anti-recombination protein RmuC
MARAKSKKRQGADITATVEDVLEQAQATLDRGMKAVAKAFPEADKAAKQLSKRVDRVSRDLEKNRKQAVKRVEKVVNDLDKRRKRVVKAVVKQRDEILDTVEARTAGVVRPLVQRLDIASHRELEKLQRRLAQVERKVSGTKSRTTGRKASARKRAA